MYGITYSANDGLLGGWAERIYLRPASRKQAEKAIRLLRAG